MSIVLLFTTGTKFQLPQTGPGGCPETAASLRSSRGPMPTKLPLFSSLLQFLIALGVDLVLTAGGHVLRRDVANGTADSGSLNSSKIKNRATPSRR